MSEIGPLAGGQPLPPGLQLSSSNCEKSVREMASAIEREASSAGQAPWDDAMAASKYVDQVAAAPGSSYTTLRPNPLQEVERAALAVLSSRMDHLKHTTPVGVVLIETLTSDSLLGYSYGFLLALRYLTARKGVLLAVDEVMMGLRTGRFFSYLHYPAFYPDLVTFGKGFQICGLASVPPADAPDFVQHSSRSPLLASLDLSCVGGYVTTGGSDRAVLERARALLWE